MKISEQFPSKMTLDILATAVASLPGGEQALDAAADQVLVESLESGNA